ncbi:MAG: hypothetical protein N2Z21_06355, partial [Candidatus Sumerlaeaceae bacterium]|nr:hypothetical protein [Candidatus Sumerlaeaceae bacterium]
MGGRVHFIFRTFSRAAAQLAAYAVLSIAALLLFVPMVWMVLSAFTPQSELQTAVPMRRTFEAFHPRMLWHWDEARSWLTSYFTVENFHSPATQTGLFDITDIPRYESVSYTHL